MAVSAQNLTYLRSSPQYSRVGMVVFRPEIIGSGTVSGSPAQGATTVSLAGYVETETPEAYYSVIAGSAAGQEDGGKTRLKSIDGSTLTLAANNIEWDTYTYVSILRVIEPNVILPDLGNDKMDGDVSYSDANSNYHPLGRIGPPAVGYVDQPVQFWSNSQAITGSLSSHAWVFPGGTPNTASSAGTAESPIEVTWSTATGHVPKYIKYTVTGSNGKTHIRRTPVWILSGFEDAYCEFEAESISGDYDSGGWQGRFRVFGNATTAEFPAEAMIVIFAKDYYGGTEVSIGGNWTHRENIIFVGWIVRGTTFQDAEDGSVSFEAVGPAGKMDQLTNWPANLEDKGTPAAWNQLSGMTCDRAAFHILTERTTMDHICDINLTGNTKSLRYVDIPESSVRQQLDEYCLLPIGARALSDRQGQIYFSRNPNLRPLAERDSIPTVMELTFDDIRADPGLELGVEEQEKECAQVDFIGFTYDGEDIEPLYSLAPANQFETGDVKKVDGVRADDQTEANVLSGMYLANFNNTFREVQAPTWNYRVFDIVPEYYTTMSLAAGDTKRGIVWSSQKLLCRSVGLSYSRDEETILVEPVFEKDSSGPPGVGGGYPKAPPRFEAYPYPDAFGVALAAWNGFYWRGQAAAAFVERGELDAVKHGCVDPWFVDRSKQGTYDPEKAILFACGAAGLVKRSTDAGRTWVTKTVDVNPTNSWADATAPVVADVEFIQVACDPWQNGRVYGLGRWQEVGTAWRGQLAYSADDGVSWAWLELDDGVTLPDQVNPGWMAVNGTYLLVTVWEYGDTLQLLVFDALTFAFVQKIALGTVTLAEFDAKTYVAYVGTVLDDDNRWYVYGRLNAPLGLTGVQHIIQTTDAGSGWSSVDNLHGVKYVAALEVGLKDPNENRDFDLLALGSAGALIVGGGGEYATDGGFVDYSWMFAKVSETEVYVFTNKADLTTWDKVLYTVGSGFGTPVDLSGTSGIDDVIDHFYNGEWPTGTGSGFLYMSSPDRLSFNLAADGDTIKSFVIVSPYLIPTLLGGSRGVAVKGTNLYRVNDYTTADPSSDVDTYASFFTGSGTVTQRHLHRTAVDEIVGIYTTIAPVNTYGYVVEFDVSYNPTLGSEVALGSGVVPVDLVMVSATEFWLFYKSADATEHVGYMISMTISGGTVVWGTPVEIYTSTSGTEKHYKRARYFRDSLAVVLYSREESGTYYIEAKLVDLGTGETGDAIELYAGTNANIISSVTGWDMCKMSDTLMLAAYYKPNDATGDWIKTVTELDWS